MPRAKKQLFTLDDLDREIAKAHGELGDIVSKPDYKVQEFKGMLDLRDRLRRL